jgi:hypothetical protein
MSQSPYDHTCCYLQKLPELGCNLANAWKRYDAYVRGLIVFLYQSLLRWRIWKWGALRKLDERDR